VVVGVVGHRRQDGDLIFDLVHAIQVLVQAGLIRLAQAQAQRRRVVQDRVEGPLAAG